ELGITGGNAQVWSQKHTEFEKLLWAEPHPRNHWPRFLSYVRHATIERYRELKAAQIADGVDPIEGAHQAADQATGELRYKTGQRRRVERDVLLGVANHETEILRRFRKGGRLTDAHSRRLGRKLLQVSRWATMERALRETGFAEADVERMMAELMGAF